MDPTKSSPRPSEIPFRIHIFSTKELILLRDSEFLCREFVTYLSNSQVTCRVRSRSVSGYATLQELTYLEAAQWFKLKVCVAEGNRIAPARRRQFRPGFGLTCFVTFAAEIDFLESSVVADWHFCAKS